MNWLLGRGASVHRKRERERERASQMALISKVENVKGRKLSHTEFDRACRTDVREGWQAEMADRANDCSTSQRKR